MIGPIAALLDQLLLLVRPLVFATGMLALLVAAGSWAVRTRRISPFSPLARFLRTAIDPWLIAPIERRLVRAGGLPYAAPWWMLALVVIGGLLLISALQFVRNQVVMVGLAIGSTSTMAAVLLRWTFSLLRIALFARVIASWVGGGPYTRGWRWAYRLTDWFLTPLRQIIPPFGMFDLSVLVAWFALNLMESLVTSVLFR